MSRLGRGVAWYGLEHLACDYCYRREPKPDEVWQAGFCNDGDVVWWCPACLEARRERAWLAAWRDVGIVVLLFEFADAATLGKLLPRLAAMSVLERCRDAVEAGP